MEEPVFVVSFLSQEWCWSLILTLWRACAGGSWSTGLVNVKQNAYIAYFHATDMQHLDYQICVPWLCLQLWCLGWWGRSCYNNPSVPALASQLKRLQNKRSVSADAGVERSRVHRSTAERFSHTRSSRKRSRDEEGREEKEVNHSKCEVQVMFVWHPAFSHSCNFEVGRCLHIQVN